MEMRELIVASQLLARPCVLLKRAGPADSFAGIWGGAPVVPGPSGPFFHWLSVDCRFIPAGIGPEMGVLSVFTNEADCESGAVAFDASAKLAGPSESRLFAHGAQSLPPPDAMSSVDRDQYVRIWQSNCPIYTRDAAAVLGGWHFPWPDGDWEELRQTPFVLWTIDDSEPWVEVWKEGVGYKVIQRIT
jgi:hypothetical protein